MNNLWREYKRSLKDTEIEEIIDLYFYRLFGFIFVKAVSWSRIKPNHITYLGMLLGLGSAILFIKSNLLSAAILLLLANVMDCADGQLARLKKNGTYLGSIVDGFFDYIVGSSTIIGMGIYLLNRYDPGLVFILTVATGLSRAGQNMLVDQRRHFYTKSTLPSEDAFQGDLEDLLQYHNNLRRRKAGLLEKIILRCGFIYFSLQRLSIRTTHITFGDFKSLGVFPEFRDLLLRAWSFLGSSTHISVAVLAALLGHVEWYFYITLIVGNFYMISLVITEIFLVRRSTKIYMEIE